MPTHNPLAAPRDLDADARKVWRRTVAKLRARGVAHVDVELLAEYVEWTRLADFHLAEAEADPYSANEDGRAFKHPGFAEHKAARVQARQVWRLLLEDAPAPAPPDLGDDEPPDELGDL